MRLGAGCIVIFEGTFSYFVMRFALIAKTNFATGFVAVLITFRPSGRIITPWFSPLVASHDLPLRHFIFIYRILMCVPRIQEVTYHDTGFCNWTAAHGAAGRCRCTTNSVTCETHLSHRRQPQSVAPRRSA